MPKYSNTSASKLATAHEDLQTIFNEVIKWYDCTIVFGYRSPEVQKELYEQGRSKPGKIVTYKDGYEKKSKHNYEPSLAVDAVPYFKESPHIRWNDIKSLYFFAGFVKGVATKLYNEGKINNKIRLGADWDSDNDVSEETFIDIVHFEIVN